MTISRRAFVGAAALGLPPLMRLGEAQAVPLPTSAEGLAEGPGTSSQGIPPGRFDPWVEIDPSALHYNVGQVSRLSGGRPILAVIKNNAYGLGLAATGRILEAHPEIWGFAVVKTDAAIRLRDSGIRKPILLMGMFSEEDGHELVARDIHLSLYTDDAGERVAPLARQAGRPIDVHLYLDTGMGRMGMPYHRALPWLEALASRNDVRIRGTYMAFVEETEFDHEQLRRFLELVRSARERGVELGDLHAASSNGVYHLPEAHLDMVRPGVALFGAYPSRPEEEREKGELRCGVRLRARVVRVARLRTGDGVSYGRNYVAERPTWIATLPVGHTDGYPRTAVQGARVLINEQLFPVIGAISASHAIVELGEDPLAGVGDVATFMGPDHTSLEPNNLARATGASVYDILMHLNPELPRIVTGA